jgi:hypothetical protein
MRRDAGKHPDVDRLLKQVFPDDLPGDAEARMAAHLDRLRKEWENAEKASPLPTSWSRLMSYSPARVVLVAVSACLIVYGFFLRPMGAPTALASSLATLQKATSVAGQVGSDRIMECIVQLNRAGESSPRYVIRWVSPKETWVRFVLGGEESLWTIRPRREDSSVLEFVTRSPEDETEDQPPLDPDLRPVEDLLTASRFRRLLAGQWRPSGIERKDGCDWESFSIGDPGEPSSTVTVDTCTFLPMKLGKDLAGGAKLEAVFRWSPPSGPGTDAGTIPS